MASASVRLLTQGWSGDQRRALVAALTEDQRRLVQLRIERERLAHKFESSEAIAAIAFLEGRGRESCGIPEYCAAVIFGRDPAFRDKWQEIRRMHDGDPVP